MHRELGLNFEAAGQDRKRFDEPAREYAIAGPQMSLNDGPKTHATKLDKILCPHGDPRDRRPCLCRHGCRRPCRAGYRSIVRSSGGRSAHHMWRLRRRSHRYHVGEHPPNHEVLAAMFFLERAISAVLSVELLSKTKTAAAGRAARKSFTTLSIAASSLKQGTSTAIRYGSKRPPREGRCRGCKRQCEPQPPPNDSFSADAQKQTIIIR